MHPDSIFSQAEHTEAVDHQGRDGKRDRVSLFCEVERHRVRHFGIEPLHPFHFATVRDSTFHLKWTGGMGYFDGGILVLAVVDSVQHKRGFGLGMPGAHAHVPGGVGSEPAPFQKGMQFLEKTLPKGVSFERWVDE